MSAALEPADLKRCQCEITTYNPWVMGGSVHRTERCPNAPHWLVSETKPREDDGLMGSMSMCDSCAVEFIKKQQLPPGDYDMEWIGEAP